MLEKKSGRSLDGALACSIATFLLLFPANILPFMTVHIGGINRTTHLAQGLPLAWQQGWPLVAITLGLVGIVLPFLRFGLLSVTLAAIRSGARGPLAGRAFRWCQTLDVWAMFDVLLIGAGIGYGRVASQIPVHIEAGGWCFLAAALMTMVTRASLERRALWRRLDIPRAEVGRHPTACTACDLVLPASAEGRRCPRCAARVRRVRPGAWTECAALTIACWILTPIAYGYPISELWKAGAAQPHTIIDGIELLFSNGFWYFGIIVFLVSVVFPFTKLIGLSWFLISTHRRSTGYLRAKTQLYRFIDEVGRWSTLDPFTVMIFAPMVQFRQVAHINFMGGAPAFLATVMLSMLATR
jgi:paraquat-inducible protein A